MKAFPHTGSFGPGTDAKQGMDLRDYFAAAALTGGLIRHHGYPIDPQGIAQSAYDIADAMMAHR